MTKLIAIVNPEHLNEHGNYFGIPTNFWVANKEAFPEGTPPVVLYQDGEDLNAVTICDNPRIVDGSDYDHTAMYFKLVRRTVLRLKDELLRIWEGADDNNIYNGSDKFPYYWEMTRDQRQILLRLNAKLLDVEKSIYERCEELRKEHPDNCLLGRINFLLDEKDPEWADEDDNIMATLCHHHRKDYNPSESWNDAPHLMKDEKGKPAHFCWLFHELYDHTGLVWEDLLRVGQITVTIKVYYNYEF